jgi:hypothetical protein
MALVDANDTKDTFMEDIDPKVIYIGMAYGRTFVNKETCPRPICQTIINKETCPRPLATVPVSPPQILSEVSGHHASNSIPSNGVTPVKYHDLTKSKCHNSKYYVCI